MTLLTLLVGLALLAILFLTWHVTRELGAAKDKLHEGMGKNAEGIQQRLERMLDLVGKQLGGMDSRIDKRVAEINNRLDAAAKLMGTVQKQYGNVEQLSTSIRQLHEAFKAPKPRGSFSEKILYDIAVQMLPAQKVHQQFTFRSGAQVDLMIETAQGKLCIDAKFPLENYLKLVEEPENADIRHVFCNDVKKHLRDIAKKYILPEESTLDSTFMYVPSDAVMYEILHETELTELASSLRVTILSPHTFYAFLTTLLAAYQSQQFEQNAKEALALIRGIQQQSGKLGEDLQILQRHVGNAAAKMGDVQTNYVKLDTQIKQTSLLEEPSPKTKHEIDETFAEISRKKIAAAR